MQSRVFCFNCDPDCTTNYTPGRYHVFYGQLSSDAVGIEELSKPTTLSSILVYPNPTTGKLNFEWDNKQSKKAEINVYNLMGQMVNNTIIQESKGLNKYELNVSDLKFGLYLVVIKTETQTLNAKFIA